MKKLLLILCCSFLATFHSHAEFRTVEQEENGLRITFELDNLRVSNDSTNLNALRFSNYGFFPTNVAARPELIQRVESFEIPKGMELGEIEIIAEIDTIKGKCIPATSPCIDGSTSEIKEIERYVGVWPPKQAAIASTEIYRGYPIANLLITPLQYNFDKEEVYVSRKLSVFIPYQCSTSTYSLRISNNEPRTRGILSDLVTIPSYEEEIESYAVLPLPNERPFYAKEAPSYLIISPVEFKSEAERFAAWKRQMGYNVHIMVPSADILQSPKDLFTEIADYYWINRDMEYLLLFGGGNMIAPAKGDQKKYTNKKWWDFYTDYYYACMDDEFDEKSDRLADFIIGRLPGQNIDEMKIMVDKTIEYTMNPPIEHENYFSNATHFSEWINDSDYPGKEGTYFIQTMERLRELLLSNESFDYNINRIYYAQSTAFPRFYNDGTSLPNELKKSNENNIWTGTHTDVVNAFNKGTAYMLYRGHGSFSNWSNAYFGMANNDINRLRNKNLYPITFAITCLSGTFYHPEDHPLSSHSLVESLLVSKDKGAAAVIGANRISWSLFNEYMLVGMFDAMYPGIWNDFYISGFSSSKINEHERTYELGKILEIGKKRMMQVSYGNTYGSDTDSYGEWNRDVFHCLGDPSLYTYCQKPQVSIPEITIHEQSMDVVVGKRRTMVILPRYSSTVYAYPVEGGFSTPGDYSDCDICFVGNGYVPVFFSAEELAGQSMKNITAKINSVTKDDSQYVVSLEGDYENTIVSLYDIYGNKLNSSVPTEATVSLKKTNSFGIIVLERNGCVIDSKNVTP